MMATTPTLRPTKDIAAELVCRLCVDNVCVLQILDILEYVVVLKMLISKKKRTVFFRLLFKNAPLQFRGMIKFEITNGNYSIYH